MKSHTIANERITPRTEPKIGFNLRKCMISIIICLAVIFVMQLVYHLILSPRMRIIAIDIESDIDITVQELASMMKMELPLYYDRIDPDSAAVLIREHILVQDAAVHKIFPNRLKIVIEGREPMLLGLAHTAQRSIPFTIDREGVIFEIGSFHANLPILSGFRFQELYLGMKLPNSLELLLHNIAVLRDDAPHLLEQISEFNVILQETDKFDVMLYPVGYQIPVRIDQAIDKEQAAHILITLDVLYEVSGSNLPYELDMRKNRPTFYTEEDI